jgi:hypothetical protein
MPTREELHALIDTMPDGAIDAAHRVLTNMQTWPPTPPRGVQEMREQMHQRMEDRRREVMQRQKPGTIAGFGGSSNYDPDKGVASSSFNHWDNDTFVHETFRRFKGHELMVIERIRLDGQRLIYKHEVSGPGGKREEQEITFDLP